jgi:Zn-dependent M16 (insulinase) family peptidase
MVINTNDKYFKNNNFDLLASRHISEIKSIGYHLKHHYNGLEVAWLKNNDTHLAGSFILFTPISDNRGISHILEHCTMCGSKKYPSDKLYIEMLSKIPNTFLNAFGED